MVSFGVPVPEMTTPSLKTTWIGMSVPAGLEPFAMDEVTLVTVGLVASPDDPMALMTMLDGDEADPSAVARVVAGRVSVAVFPAASTMVPPPAESDVRAE